MNIYLQSFKYKSKCNTGKFETKIVSKACKASKSAKGDKYIFSFSNIKKN